MTYPGDNEPTRRIGNGGEIPPPPPPTTQFPSQAYSAVNESATSAYTSPTQFDAAFGHGENRDSEARAGDIIDRYRTWVYENRGTLARNLPSFNGWQQQRGVSIPEEEIGAVRQWVSESIPPLEIDKDDWRFNVVKGYLSWLEGYDYTDQRNMQHIEEWSKSGSNGGYSQTNSDERWAVLDWAEGLFTLKKNDTSPLVYAAVGIAAVLILLIGGLVWASTRDNDETPVAPGNTSSTSTMAKPTTDTRAAEERAERAREKSREAQEAKESRARKAAEEKAAREKAAAESRANRIVVPNVTASTVDDAVDALESAGFSVARTGVDQNGNRVSLGSNGDKTVTATNPVAGTVASKSDNPEVTLTVHVPEKTSTTTSSESSETTESDEG